ncbi:MAG: hypothetical protein KF745_07730 [Phycisphaeraceae bacterium]|nr:hypothetical protein [Phycisphaeraceae bacterium]
MPTALAPPRQTSATSLALCAIPASLIGVAIGYPAVAAIAAVAWPSSRGGEPAPTASSPAPLSLVAATILWPLVIAVLSTLIALPAAWLLRAGSRRRSLAAFVAVPLLLPNYLAYAGWGLLRAPMTFLGDLLATQSQTVQVAVNKAIAILGLSLWAWPVAALVLAVGARRIPQSLLDSLSLDAAGAPAPVPMLRRWLVLLTLLRPALAWSVALVTLIMLGSPVPLHLAQIETYSVEIWRRLSLTTDLAPVWAASWPLVLVSLAGVAALVSRLSRPTDPGADTEITAPPAPPRRSLPLLILAAAIWALSIIVPFVLFLLALRDPPHSPTLASMLRLSTSFWQTSGDAVVSSLGVGACTGLLALLLTLSSWAALSLSPSRLIRSVMLVMIACSLLVALLPGVLVGSAIAAAWNSPATRFVSDTPIILVLAHTARFGFIPMTLGWWLAALESRAERDLRRPEGDSLRAFVLARLLNPAAGGLAALGGAVAVGILSIHEIESTIMVLPPGNASLSQQVLEYLHYARDERLAACAVNLLAVAVAAAYLSARLIASTEPTPASGFSGTATPPHP